MAFYDLHPSYSNVVNQVIADDIPSLVRQANKVKTTFLALSDRLTR